MATGTATAVSRLNTQLWVLFFALALPVAAQPTNTFVIASYNVANWNLIERNRQPNQPKPDDEKQAVWRVVQSIQPDVLGVMEMGTTNDLAEFAAGLRARGLDYPHTEWVPGADTNRHVALLSRHPIRHRFSRSDYTYRLGFESARMSRGLLDVEIQVGTDYRFRAIVLHLKSRRAVDYGDQEYMRLQEARLARQHIEQILQKNPRQNLIVMGDLNDKPDSLPVRTIIGAPPLELFDLNPADARGYHDTHFWCAVKQWSRIDYLLPSPGMWSEYVAGSARLVTGEDWLKGSDHKALLATFFSHDLDELTVFADPAELRQRHRRLTLGALAVLMAVLLVGLYWRASRAPPAAE